MAAASLALGTVPAGAAVYTFTNGAGTGQYTTASNWSGNVVPNTSNGDTAIINDGVAVSYTPGGDLVIKNGGILQVTSGSFTQTGGNNFIQLNGNGTVLVNGGTFNQGTDSATPFNLTGTGNAFTVTAGSATINTSFSLNPGLTFTQSGGTVNVTAAGTETDFNGGGATLSGGNFITNLITGVNATVMAVFNISGGQLTLSSNNQNGIYGGGTMQYLNFTTGSTGKIDFLASTGSTISTVQGDISANKVEFNNTPYSAATGYSNFSITSDGAGGFFLGVANPGVPEPSTVALAALGAAGLLGWTLRRRSRLRPGV